MTQEGLEEGRMYGVSKIYCKKNRYELNNGK